jgi:hypothetical protein
VPDSYGRLAFQQAQRWGPGPAKGGGYVPPGPGAAEEQGSFRKWWYDRMPDADRRRYGLMEEPVELPEVAGAIEAAFERVMGPMEHHRELAQVAAEAVAPFLGGSSRPPAMVGGRMG